MGNIIPEGGPYFGATPPKDADGKTAAEIRDTRFRGAETLKKVREDVKKRGAWSKECCTKCGAEGLASRGGDGKEGGPSSIKQGPYVCGDCQMWQAGYDDGVKNRKDSHDKLVMTTYNLKMLQAEVIRACTRLYLNELPTAVRAYELLTHAMDQDILKEECVPLAHPSRSK
jgi:hypothetical protein